MTALAADDDGATVVRAPALGDQVGAPVDTLIQSKGIASASARICAMTRLVALADEAQPV